MEGYAPLEAPINNADDHSRRSNNGEPARASAARLSNALSDADRASLSEHGADWKAFLFDSFALMFGGTQLGYAMGQMGWGWGSWWLFFSAASTWLSGHLIGEMCTRTGAASFPELGELAFGGPGRVGVTFLQWCGYYLGGVTQIAFLGATWDQTFSGWAWSDGICEWQWMLITVLVLWPFMQVPSFTSFAGLAGASSLAALFGTFVYLGEIARNGQYAAGGGPCWDRWTTGTMLANICNMAFTYSGHGTFPEQIRELKDPAKDFAFAFDVLYAVAMCVSRACERAHARARTRARERARPRCSCRRRRRPPGAARERATPPPRDQKAVTTNADQTHRPPARVCVCVSFIRRAGRSTRSARSSRSGRSATPTRPTTQRISRRTCGCA